MTSVALLILRVTVGSLLAGHGAQKLFGSFGGHGVEGTAGWLESMNLRPGRQWALAAGLSEFGGGVLTVLGALNPLGPIAALGSMLMATFKVHSGKPIWVTAGGAELPVTNMAVQGALILAGPGRLSVDTILGIRVPRWFVVSSIAGMIATVALAVRSSEAVPDDEPDALDQKAGAELQGGVTEQMDPTQGDGAAPAGRPDLSAHAPNVTPGVEAWGSPDAGDGVVEEEPAVAAMNRELP